MQTAVNSALMGTTVQVDLNDIYGKPTETNVTFNLYKAGTKEKLYSYTHTLNQNRLPDTLVINDKVLYDIEVFSTPVVRASNIKIIPHKHNVIEVDAPRGELMVRLINPLRSYYVPIRVYVKGDDQTLNVQQVGEKDMYIVGSYEIEILTLPRSRQTVEIKQDQVTTVSVPSPGEFVYTTGNALSAQVFLLDKDGGMEWVCNLSSSEMNGSISLQPGEYVVVYRALMSMNTLHTQRKEFRIVSNKTTTLNL
jgi:Ca-activated chloride channel family protein